MVDRKQDTKQTPHRAAVLELHRLGRGLCGGVLLALPAIYTMELWWLGYATPAWHVVAILFVTWMLCFAMSCIEGMAGHLKTRGQLAAGLEALAGGLLIGGLFVVVLGLSSEMHVVVGIRQAALLAVPAAFGYTLAVSQLGEHGEAGVGIAPGAPDWTLADLGRAAAGAIFVGVAISPIEEITLIGALAEGPRLLVLAGLAIALSALMIDIAGVRGHVGPPPSVDHHSPWPPALVTFALALLLAALFVWAFGYGGPSKGVAEVLALMVALALPMTVGAAAGRLIL